MKKTWKLYNTLSNQLFLIEYIQECYIQNTIRQGVVSFQILNQPKYNNVRRIRKIKELSRK